MKIINEYGDFTSGFKQRVRAEYKKLIASGLNKKEAGINAIKWVDSIIDESKGVAFLADSWGPSGNHCVSGIMYVDTGYNGPTIGFDTFYEVFVWESLVLVTTRGGDRWNF